MRSPARSLVKSLLKRGWHRWYGMQIPQDISLGCSEEPEFNSKSKEEIKSLRWQLPGFACG